MTVPQYRLPKPTHYGEFVRGENMNHPERKPNRIPQYDYSTPNYYFITICTHNRNCLFGTVENLNGFGQIAAEVLLEIPKHFPHASVDKFIVMPNHIHAIIVLRDTPVPQRQSLSVILGQYKATVSKRIHRSMPDKQIWQKSYYDRVIRNEQNYRDAWRYIDENPVRWYVNRGLPCPFSPEDI